jgi:beta-lactam-binding protein with PASTA domain
MKSNQNQEKNSYHYFTSFKRIAAIYFVAFSIFLFVSFIILMLLTKSTKEVRVPDVVGKRFLEVYNKLDRLGVRPKIRYRDVFDNDDGLILRQHPESGEIVTEGTPLTLYISRNVFFIDVPNLIGSELPIALNKLKNQHSQGRSISLGNGVISYIPSSKSADNIIIDQSPRPGERITPSKKINLLVSSGKLETENKMPNLVGQSIDLCFDLLRAKGVFIYEEIVETADKEKSGIIAAQNPVPGALIAKDEMVKLNVMYFPIKDHPYHAYEKVSFTIPEDKEPGLYEAYIEDFREKRIRFSQNMKSGQRIEFVFLREGDAKVTLVGNKKSIRVLGFKVEEF